MIRRKADIRVRNVENAQGGEGTVTFSDWLLPEEAAGHGRTFSTLVIPPGASIGYHEHEGEFEAYLVLSGEATVNDNGEEVTLYEGDMNLCKDGAGHGTKNNTDKDLVLMALIMNSLG
ncbi:MAG: cupin domain-containing protein [Lachnospiraceae bacterium]|nr:cupin domain-containing protein [Lachnospiraceae bacterium]